MYIFSKCKVIRVIIRVIISYNLYYDYKSIIYS